MSNDGDRDSGTITDLEEFNEGRGSDSRITIPPPAGIPASAPTERAAEAPASWESEIAAGVARMNENFEEFRAAFNQLNELNAQRRSQEWEELRGSIQAINARLEEGEKRFERIELAMVERDERDRKRIDAITALALKPHALPLSKPLFGLTVLVLEDDDALRKIMVDVCTGTGARSFGAASVEQAIEYLRDPTIDVATVDILLGHNDGMGFVRKLRAQYPGIGVLVASGRVSDAQGAECRLLGAGVLEKPFTPDELVAAVLACRGTVQHHPV